MNATCTPSTCSPSTRSAPSVGVTENLQKPVYTVAGNDDVYEVRVQLPGVAKGGVKIDLEDNVLSIRGERQSTVPEGWKPLHRELSTLGYQLRLRLNTPVDEDKLTANLENGVLTLKLPVKEAAKPRRIEVQ
ncbi:HSP20 family protein [Prosthecobacter fusiformis]|uniref:HSP20 family protein n=1 Tax=Prosthecobacter fusiformis TaxID=48464 RepID=A0A4R7RY51_9BACT|nr:Hsp20/alpha crystallin family protein [Prosthecobacter fusiformis]TDU70864.1 HSP20 family protein [Prosthecobacter fusiformis]